MGEVLVRCGVKRASGYLYFVDKKGNVARAKMARGGGKKGKQKQEVLVKTAIKRDKGYLYYVDAKGNLCRAKMARRGKRR